MSFMALLLDLANILGGFLLAVVLLRSLPGVGEGLRGFADRIAPFGWIIGIVAMVAGIFHLLDNIAEGRIYHFELVGIGVGVALLWDRLIGRGRPKAIAATPASAPGTATGTATGLALLLGIFGLVAIIVGLQGLFTPDG